MKTATDKGQEPEMDLASLSDSALGKLVETRSEQLSEMEQGYWSAACEQMVRAIKASWPSGHYIGLSVDSNEYGERWSLDAIYDAFGGVLASYEIDSEGFNSFEESFVNEYRHIYTREFGIDNYPYFDLETRDTLTEDQYNKNVAGMAV